jgi:hypothetical protein
MIAGTSSLIFGLILTVGIAPLINAVAPRD